MTKTEFLRKYRSDRDFRYDAKQRGIRVIGDNVIFMNNDGTVKKVFGAYIK